jgi:hypothetical protein
MGTTGFAPVIGVSIAPGVLTTFVSGALTLAQPVKISTPIKLMRHAMIFSTSGQTGIDPKGHGFTCIMSNLFLKCIGFNGTPSTNNFAALAKGVHCDGRFHGSPVGHCVSLRFAWQQFNRQFTRHGPSQLELAAISFNWAYFGGHLGTI